MSFDSTDLINYCLHLAPDTKDMAIQCERDEDMTVRLLDLKAQGITDFHQTVINLVGQQIPSS